MPKESDRTNKEQVQEGVDAVAGLRIPILACVSGNSVGVGIEGGGGEDRPRGGDVRVMGCLCPLRSLWVGKDSSFRERECDQNKDNVIVGWGLARFYFIRLFTPTDSYPEGSVPRGNSISIDSSPSHSPEGHSLAPRTTALSNMTPQSLNHLTSSSVALATRPQLPLQNDEGFPLLALMSQRRAVLFSSLVSVVPSITHSSPASAFSIGIPGPKEWLKEQKRKSSKFLLAPIFASRESLQSAYFILSKGSEYSTEDADEIQRLFRSAARDCVARDRNSFVTFQANTGVEVCTFALVVNNAASLLDNKDPVKLEAEAVLNNLIRSFSSLNSLANETDFQAITSRQKIVDALMDTITSLDKFEKRVKDCLES